MGGDAYVAKWLCAGLRHPRRIPGVNFLISTMPARGHVNPALPLAAELVRRDHEVWWHTGRGYVFAKQAGEGLLDHVLRLGDRAQHAGGYIQRVAAVLLPGRTHRDVVPVGSHVPPVVEANDNDKRAACNVTCHIRSRSAVVIGGEQEVFGCSQPSPIGRWTDDRGGS
jgi:hypothetical protein